MGNRRQLPTNRVRSLEVIQPMSSLPVVRKGRGLLTGGAKVGAQGVRTLW